MAFNQNSDGKIEQNMAGGGVFKKSFDFYFSHLPAEVFTLGLKLQRRRTACRQGLRRFERRFHTVQITGSETSVIPKAIRTAK
jgi:hypothetical protein